MSFLEIARRRQSERRFTAQPVEREKIERCLEAARLAPSACNSQPWFFVVVDEPQLVQQVAAAAQDLVMNHFVSEAPVLIALVDEGSKLVPRLAGIWQNKSYHLMDVSMAAENFCLAATDEGLGTCMVGWFSERRVKRILQIPRGRRVPLLIAMGYPRDERTRRKSRKPADEIRSYNAYPSR